MKTHPVTFVGAGPGDPELITVKGQKAVQEADLVVYAGSLVPEALLQWASPECLVENSAEMHLDEIVSTMAAAQRSGKRVVRLHTGDPSLYGAIAEQITALKKQEIPFRVIPGVTAAFAAAAAMGVEFTLPEVSQTLILTRMAGRTPVPEAETLASLAEHRASMAVYLSIAMIDRVAEVLKQSYGEDAPAAIAYRVSQPDERIFRTTVGGLSDLVRKENIRKTALILVGDALNQGASDTDRKSRLYDRAFTHEYRRGEG